ncbi:MAG: sigma-54-dependent Fis family transcriptional regulator [Spirochaetales bacterium]|nr:sigma-54-dependent Fis family transcriptional regulator [Spirochaetales bacterium]
MKRILVIDDDQAILNYLNLFLLQTGKFDIHVLQDSRKAFSMLENDGFHILLLDMDMPHVTGLDILEFIRSRNLDIITIVLTGVEDIDLAIKAMKLKTFDYLLKPIDEEKIMHTLGLAIDRSELIGGGTSSLVPLSLESLSHREIFRDIITRNNEMMKIFHFVEKFAPTNNSILIWGESGTGKELIARAIHRISKRKDRKFVAVNAGAFANELFVSEFFGHEKGAFSGAVKDKKGFIEEAFGGTLFLDEIGELSLPIQVKLLRVLQEEEFYRLGSTTNRKADVRIIAATNKNLFDEINRGNFRKDLFFRLNINSIYLPPLRERKEDIELLSYHFLNLYNKKYDKHVTKISPPVLSLLQRHDFPGNVRELMNIINSSIIIESSQELSMSSLPHYFHEQSKTEINDFTVPAPGSYDSPLQSLEELERDHIGRVLRYTNMNRTKAARILGISRVSLIAKIKKYGIG